MNTETENRIPASEYDFPLPKELIAQHPLSNREDARLLVVDRQQKTIEHSHFRNLVDWLRPGDCLVLNETRVIPAKLSGHRTRSGGRWQGLYLDHDPQTGVIKVLCKTRGRLQPGETITLQDREGRQSIRLAVLARLEDGAWAVRPETGIPVAEFLEQLGRVPLPHYIRGGNMTDADVQDYQTVYARKPGSVAAPTAGLHFSDRLLTQVIDAGINICKVTLHVGIGTFRPIAGETIEDHRMHGESGTIDQSAINLIQATREQGGRIVAVGTTSVRLLETVAQHEPLRPWTGTTDLYIRPGFRFRMVDCLITNFHLPRTTLLVLVRTFGGDELIKEAYQQAIDQRYRFFSYGDAMLIL
jgi:S-adenosylmethionine:tRNA ribosyltransferase-isomerase